MNIWEISAFVYDKLVNWYILLSWNITYSHHITEILTYSSGCINQNVQSSFTAVLVWNEPNHECPSVIAQLTDGAVLGRSQFTLVTCIAYLQKASYIKFK